jgi:hypothetical protein
MGRIHIEYAAACERIRLLQSEVGRQRAILARHDAWLRAGEDVRSPSTDLDAYDHLLLAREHLHESASALADELPEAAARLLALAAEAERTTARDQRGERAAQLQAPTIAGAAVHGTLQPQLEVI